MINITLLPALLTLCGWEVVLGLCDTRLLAQGLWKGDKQPIYPSLKRMASFLPYLTTETDLLTIIH